MSHRRRLLNLAVLAIVNLLWAAQYPAYKVASDHMAVASLNFWTLAFAILILLPFLGRQKHPGSRRRENSVRDFLLMGLLGIVPPSVFMSWGIAHSTASNAAIISMTIPVLMILMGIVMLGERLTLLRGASLFLGLAGTLLISRSDIAQGTFHRQLLLGNAVIFLAGMGSAFYNTFGKNLLARYSELEVLIYSYIVGCSACAVLSVLTDARPFYRVDGYPWSAWLAVMVLGAFSWGIAMVLWMWVLKRLEVAQVSVSIYLLPVFGVLLSVITLHERLAWIQAAGGGLVVFGTFLTSEYEARRNAVT